MSFLIFNKESKKNKNENIKKEYKKQQQKLKVELPIKDVYQVVIPQNIFQTWTSKKILPPKMFETFLKIRRMNPRFRHYLFDDKECREFIKSYFKPDVLHAYDHIVPGAYKADLWRYCVLFIHGGIYLDVKYTPLNGFRFIQLCEKEHWVLDADGQGVYNALMVCKPRNPILFQAIRKIVQHVGERFYGNNYLAPTGPHLLKEWIPPHHPDMDLHHKVLDNDPDMRIIYSKQYPILRTYPRHIEEKTAFSKTAHYSQLWEQKGIYI